MANWNWQNFWQDVGNNALNAVCFPVYGTTKAIIQGASGDGWGAFETGAETLCPLGIGQTTNSIERFSRGDIAGGFQKALEAGAPSSMDPVTNSITTAISNTGKQGIQAAIDAHNANQKLINDLLTQQNKAKEEEKKQDVEEEEQKTIVEKEEARDITNQQANTARKAAYQAAINSGATPAQAQAAADAQTPIGNFAGNYAALAGAGANARANYRERQGYADALERETLNLAEARNREIAAAALQGMGNGFQFGAGITPFGNSGNSGNSVGGGN